MTSTALVPAEMYDAQILQMIHEIDNPKPKQPTDADLIKSIWVTLDSISVEGAISILEALGYKNDEFHDKQGIWKISDLARASYFPECEGRRADDTPKIVFWGGPPGQLTWYKGNLFTLLKDRILCEIETRGLAEVAKYIGTDVTTVLC